MILTIGCGFKQHAIVVRPRQSTKHIQVDVDPAEINRDHVADVAILGDAKVVLGQFIDAAKSRLPAARQARNERRVQEIAALKAEWEKVCDAAVGCHDNTDQSIPRDPRIRRTRRPE